MRQRCRKLTRLVTRFKRQRLPNCTWRHRPTLGNGSVLLLKGQSSCSRTSDRTMPTFSNSSTWWYLYLLFVQFLQQDDQRWRCRQARLFGSKSSTATLNTKRRMPFSIPLRSMYLFGVAAAQYRCSSGNGVELHGRTEFCGRKRCQYVLRPRETTGPLLWQYTFVFRSSRLMLSFMMQNSSPSVCGTAFQCDPAARWPNQWLIPTFGSDRGQPIDCCLSCTV